MKFINPILTSFKFIIIGYLALVFSNILYDAFSPDHSVQGRYKIAQHDDELLPLFAPWEFWSKTTPAINFQNEEPLYLEEYLILTLYIAMKATAGSNIILTVLGSEIVMTTFSMKQAGYG